MPVFITTAKCKTKNVTSPKNVRRDFSQRNIQNFNCDLNNTHWEEKLASDNVDEAYNEFLSCVLYDKHYPKYEFQSRINETKLPWLTEGLYNSIREKNYLYKKYLKNPTIQNKSVYIHFKNKLTGLIGIAKRQYLGEQFDKEKYNAKGTWKLINSLLNKSNAKTNSSYYLQNDAKIDSEIDIANAFNVYFINIGNKIANELPPSPSQFEHFLSPRCPYSLFFAPVTEIDIAQTISKLPSGEAPGYDGLSSYAIKQAGNALATPLSILINKSFVTGHFPDSLKLGKVVSIFKTRSKHEISNYRPITILFIFSKVFEKNSTEPLDAFYRPAWSVIRFSIRI